MKLNEIVEKVYLMNMEKREDRLFFSKMQLDSNNIDYEIFPINKWPIFLFPILCPLAWISQR